jgi:hypothetical protein
LLLNLASRFRTAWAHFWWKWLDQDLPNYAQHEIPIFSLPQVRGLFG